KLVRRGDTLVVTRLDRLGRSVVHLVLLGAELRERGVGLKVLEQGIDTATAEGRAMFGMLSVLAELQRELIVANTRDGLAAARARGRNGGRRPKLTADQAATAQRLYDEGEHTVQQIADILGVKRGTLYGHLDKTSVGTRPRAAKTAARSTAQTSAPPEPDTDVARRPIRAQLNDPGSQPTPEVMERLQRQRAAMRGSRCPSCGNEPVDPRARWQQRQDLAITWLYPDSKHSGAVVELRHCVECQPHQRFQTIVCPLCGDGPIVAGDLADAMPDEHNPPEPVQRWLDEHGWQQDPDHGLICREHQRARS
ncbi:MAG TPA: recombinase family protein, partial [Amycolatopsis sp.]|uniref:recombinase family protein n=1 Tax=Amycolatopsis sp. TaxID=37632 RepID=UPI002B495737